MPRITKADLLEIELLREQRRELDAKEKRLRKRLEQAGLAVGAPLKRGEIVAVLVPYDGQPRVKDAYIALKGEAAYARLPRPKHNRLEIKRQ